MPRSPAWRPTTLLRTMAESGAIIRKLQAPDDAELWRSIRLRALREAPTAFAWPADIAEGWPLSRFESQLKTAHCFVSLEDDRPAGCLGYYTHASPVLAHRAHVFGTFVAEEHRGKGLGKRMFEAMFDAASETVAQFELEVGCDNLAALGLYLSAGFRIIGQIPSATIIEGIVRDDYLMHRPHTSLALEAPFAAS